MAAKARAPGYTTSIYPVRAVIPGGPDPIGVLEIAQRLGKKVRTVHMWVFRGNLPPADYVSVNGSRAWEWSTIEQWARDTGRLGVSA